MSAENTVAVGLIGVGNMGSGLTRGLLVGGYRPVVWNRTPDKVEPLRELGAVCAASPTEVAKNSELVILCLSDYATSLRLLDQPEILSSLSGKTVVQFAIGTGAQAEEMQSLLAQADAQFLGGFIKAYPRQIGTDVAELHLSGDASAFERYSLTLASMGRPRFIGTDVAIGAKLNNSSLVLMQTMLAGFFESATYALNMGVPLDTILSVYSTTARIVLSTVEQSGKELAAQHAGPAVEAALAVHTEGLSTALLAIEHSGFRHSLGRAALQRFSEACDSGYGHREMSALVESIQSQDERA